MPRRFALFVLMTAGVGGLRTAEVQAGEPPEYEVYAVTQRNGVELSRVPED
jgi:hypothetical protein